MKETTSKVVEELVRSRGSISLEPEKQDAPAEELEEVKHEAEEEIESFSRIRTARSKSEMKRRAIQYANDGMPDYRLPDQYGYRSAFRWGGYGRPPIKPEAVDWERLRNTKLPSDPKEGGFWFADWLPKVGLPWPIYAAHDTEIFDRVIEIYDQHRKEVGVPK